jgi:branched-chain amino acid transport system ATP-binding protein
VGPLDVVNLEVVYAKVIHALKGVSLTVGEGQIVAVFGPNGAGKTTLARAISGLLPAHDGAVTRGEVRANGARIDTREPADIVQAGIYQIPEGGGMFEELTVQENLLLAGFAGRNGRVGDSEIGRALAQFPLLRARAHEVAGYLSGGERQMLAFCRALLVRPRLLVLDEPSLGLAPLVNRQHFDLLKALSERHGLAVLLIEQNARLALSIAHYGYVMEGGRVVYDGTAEALRDHPAIQASYLGLSASGLRTSYRNVKYYARRARWLA